MFQLQCQLCKECIIGANAHTHLRSHSEQKYAALKFEVSTHNIRDLIRVEMEKSFELLKRDIHALSEIPPEYIPKLQISTPIGNGLALTYEIVTGEMQYEI